MRRGLVAFGALTLVGLGLTACGIMRYEQREPWRSEAEEACLSSGQVRPSAAVVRAAKIDGPGACGYFTTVLGPGADAFHYDPLHIDLARHDPRGERAICKPLLKFSPRL